MKDIQKQKYRKEYLIYPENDIKRDTDVSKVDTARGISFALTQANLIKFA